MKKLFFIITLLSSISCFAQWSQVNNGITDLSQGATIFGHSVNYIFAGTFAGSKMYRSNDNGIHWSEVTPPFIFAFPNCGYFFSGKFFVGFNTSGSCIYYTSDDGTSWTTGIGSPATTNVRGFISLSTDIFAFTATKGIYRSSDGGVNWTEVNNGLSNLNIASMEVINNKLIAASIGAGIFVSSDNGSTWVQSNSGIAGGDLNAGLVWRMGTNLYYYAQGGGSYKSVDEGLTWTIWTKPPVFGLGPNEIYRSGGNLYLESRHFDGGLKDSIYYSVDEGLSWTNITGNLSATDLNASKITEFNGYVFIAYDIISPNLGIYRRATTVGINEQINNNINISVYPNPTNNLISIKVDSKFLGSNFIISDQLGRQVSSGKLSNEITTVDFSSFSKGLYLLQVGHENKQTFKVIK